METGEISSSSVIIQCSDPNSLYDVFAPRLSSRTPLRNLHWKSPTRPLRSIPTLNVSITREGIAQQRANSTIRRHQIPGLRQTPYVKLLLLRCDDKESYKDTARKDVRQWVKSVTTLQDGKSQKENHDAFEWMVVHIVMPNTPAASQPKSSKHISLGDTDSTDSLNSKSKWTGKSSSTIYDKLRADLSSHSKSGINRVAQVRIQENKNLQSAINSTELEESWQDLIENIKTCILKSFDARVAQYEEDIRERDLQRNLPGWNFCTFFILKEGLALGFENVGLLDDALAVYEELTVGLNSFLQDRTELDDFENDSDGTLLKFSKDLKNIIRTAIDPDLSETKINDDKPWTLEKILKADKDKFPFDIEKKKYRELILASEVSALDFRIYMFTREMEVLLRLSNISKPPAGLPPTQADKESIDLQIVTELLERATEFITSAGRSLRHDFYMAWGGQEGLSGKDLRIQELVISNIISTWIWCSTVQILSVITSFLSSNFKSNISLGTDVLEVHSHSESSNGDTVGLENPDSEKFDNSRRSSTTKHKGIPKSNPHIKVLNNWIAQLFLLARKTLEELEATKDWTQHIKSLPNSENPNLQQDLKNDTNTPIEEKLTGLSSSTLKLSATSYSKFSELHLLLSCLAYKFFDSANSQKSAKQILIDLAIFEYHNNNYQLVTHYIGHVLGPDLFHYPYGTNIHLLQLYAECLNRTNQPNDYAKCLIACLRLSKLKNIHVKEKTIHDYLERLFEVAKVVDFLSIPLSDLLEVSGQDCKISHSKSDGISVTLPMRSLTSNNLPSFDMMKLRIIAINDHEPEEIILEAQSGNEIGTDFTSVLFISSISTLGWYKLDMLEIQLGNINFLHHFPSKLEEETHYEHERMSSRILPIMIYPSPDCLDIRLRSASVTYLSKLQRICISLMTGSSILKNCTLKIKSTTAGLRLHLRDSILLEEESDKLQYHREGDSLLLGLSDLQANTKYNLETPFSIENITEPFVSVKIEANYETSEGSFKLYETFSNIKIILPITITTQDLHREDTIFTRFLITPATLVPLRLIHCDIVHDDKINVEFGGNFNDPLIVFPKHPASWIVRLVPKTMEKPTLTLIIDFQNLDEIIVSAFSRTFLTDLGKSPYKKFSRLLNSHLVSRIKSTWTEQDLEMAGLSQDLELWAMTDLDWEKPLSALDTMTREEVYQWLAKWHSERESILLDANSAPIRQLRLDIDLRTPPIIINTILKLSHIKDTYHIGQPIRAELIIEPHSRNLQGKEIIEIVFELITNSDTWLVGGRRKGSCTMERFQTPIILIPQRLGHTLFPLIDIKCRKFIGNDPTSITDWIEEEVEIHNNSIARSLRIISGLNDTTVELFPIDNTHESTKVMMANVG